MTVIFILCLAWSIEAEDCVAVAVLRAETPLWSDLPCEELCPPRLRPRLIGCHKTRGVAM